MKVNKAIVMAGVVLLLVIVLFGLGYRAYAGANTRAEEIEGELAAAKEDIAGYKKYAAYVANAKQALVEQKDQLVAKIVREQNLVRHVQKNPLVFRADADVTLHLAINYSFGLDLSDDKFDISSSVTEIQVTVGAPVMLTPPSVEIVSVEVRDKTLVVDEDKASAELMKPLADEFAAKGKAMAQDAEIQALCEKKLINLVRAYLEKQQGVKLVPTITVTYRS